MLQAISFMYKVFDYFKRKVDAICVALFFYRSLRRPPSFVPVTIHHNFRLLGTIGVYVRHKLMQ
jgi:hypothetical protein